MRFVLALCSKDLQELNPEALKQLGLDNQEEHHKTRTVEEEFRMFLQKYGVAYDEAYVWD